MSIVISFHSLLVQIYIWPLGYCVCKNGIELFVTNWPDWLERARCAKSCTTCLNIHKCRSNSKAWAFPWKPLVAKPLPNRTGHRKFITALTRALHLSLFWDRSIQFMLHHLVNIRKSTYQKSLSMDSSTSCSGKCLYANWWPPFQNWRETENRWMWMFFVVYNVWCRYWYTLGWFQWTAELLEQFNI
jgi:hypothetical protein